jgi:hypothetical protein
MLGHVFNAVSRELCIAKWMTILHQLVPPIFLVRSNRSHRDIGELKWTLGCYCADRYDGALPVRYS